MFGFRPFTQQIARTSEILQKARSRYTAIQQFVHAMPPQKMDLDIAVTFVTGVLGMCWAISNLADDDRTIKRIGLQMYTTMQEARSYSPYNHAERTALGCIR